MKTLKEGGIVLLNETNYFDISNLTRGFLNNFYLNVTVPAKNHLLYMLDFKFNISKFNINPTFTNK